HYLGVGLVDPVDSFAQANPPSNEILLDALAQYFADHHYDIRHLESRILNSRVYQLSSRTNETNWLDRKNYAHAYFRPMMAEVFLDVLNSALDATENFGADAPPGSRAVEVGASRLQNGNLAYCLRLFGRPPRNSACDCERALDPALPQTLYLMADPAVQDKLKQSRRLRQLLQGSGADREILEDLFLATLTRRPNGDEVQSFEDYRRGTMDRVAAFTDVLWALINTREFILNH